MIIEEFGELISTSLEDFLKMQYGEEVDISKIAEDTAHLLYINSAPSFYSNRVNQDNKYLTMRRIWVSNKNWQIHSCIKEYFRSIVGEGEFSIEGSKIENQIVCINSQHGLPLYTYFPIKMYEKAYECDLNSGGHIGRHLVQSKKEDWTELPSPIPQDSWGSSYCNERVKEKNEETRELFDKACSETPRCIIINENDTGVNGKYQCVETVDCQISNKV